MQDAPDAMLRIDCAQAAGAASDLIRQSVESSGADGIVLGLSGGLDSALVAALCAPVCRTLALIMPDSGITPGSETGDAEDLAGKLGIEHKTIDIAPIVGGLAERVEPHQSALGNARARIRMTLLYYHANSRNLLVAGTGDRSEILTGYFTKHGDGAADIYPIASLYKIQARELARHLGVPERIVAKKSAPYLSDSTAAEDELGAAYEEIDPILACIVDGRMDDAEASAMTGADEATVRAVRSLYESSAHKRAAGPGGGAR